MPEFYNKFWEEEDRGLQKPDLACLRLEADLYKTLLMQHNAELHYNSHGLYYTHPDVVIQKFDRFFQIAEDSLAELVITPEYSCPWPVISKLIKTDRLPEEENLWIVGSQSIAPKALTEFIEDHPEVTWIYEKKVLQKSLKSRKRFFDPVCIFLKTRDKNDNERPVIIIQFKTHFFGGTDFEWERDNLMCGEGIFLIENRDESTKLLTFICSDTLGKKLDYEKLNPFINHPYLFVHIQLNQRPNNSHYKDYRNRLYASAFQNKEVITLNWARGVIIDGVQWNQYGGSGLYSKWPKLNLSDDRFNNNHHKGLYYTSWTDKKAHAYMMNYDEHVFLMDNTKPSQLGDSATQQKRTGPVMLELYRWEENDWKACERADDGFQTFCSQFVPDYGDMGKETGDMSPLDVERLINFSVGRSAFTSDWSMPNQLRSVQINDDEILRRIHFSQEPNSEAIKDRGIAVSRFLEFKNLILTKPANVPDRFLGASLYYDKSLPKSLRYLLNLHREDSSSKGTAIFLGARGKALAEEFKLKIEKLFTENQQGKNLLVYYYYNNVIRRIPEVDETPKITDNPSKSSHAINGRRSV